MHHYVFMNTLPHLTDDQMAQYTMAVIESYEKHGINGITFETTRCPEHTDRHQAVTVRCDSERGEGEFPFIFQGELLFGTMDGLPMTEPDEPQLMVVNSVEDILALLAPAGTFGGFTAGDLLS